MCVCACVCARYETVSNSTKIYGNLDVFNELKKHRTTTTTTPTKNDSFTVIIPSDIQKYSVMILLFLR